MKQKTRIHAEDGKQELVITRDFDLPLELLFKAYIEPEILEQWMGTKVLKLESKRHGSYQFVTTDPFGNKHGFNGVIHELIPNRAITRTFEMESAPPGARKEDAIQLEFLEFEALGDDRSKLTMHVVYRSVAYRDEILKLPFAQGVNMAHNRLEEVASKLLN